jgi:hypothetical protein
VEERAAVVARLRTPKEFVMCLRVRDVDSEQQRAVQEPPVIRGARLSRPRLVGAVAAVVAAAAVAAALVFPSSTTAVVGGERSGAPVAGPVIEQTATTMDDGVPSSTDVARSQGGAGPCHHEL